MGIFHTLCALYFPNCRELCLPIARALGVPTKNLFANRMNWQVGAHA